MIRDLIRNFFERRRRHADERAAVFAAVFIEECDIADVDPLVALKGETISEAERSLWESFDDQEKLEAIKMAIVSGPLSHLRL